MGFLKFFRLRFVRKFNPRRVVDCGGDENGCCSSTITIRKDNTSLARKEFSWEEMKKGHAMKFSRVIGVGGFSTVYLAKFPDSTQAAIKVHDSSSQRLNRIYKQELEILLRISHPNIVKLIGHEQEQGVLVFEYVPNGTLQEKLHTKTKALIPWKTRMCIAYQLAGAIEYLHENCSPQIIHGDIKASNILLDERFDCKLCDFGSAKIGFASMVLPPSSSRMDRMIIMGSQGYMDPHYLKTGMISKKNDIYSFGVILLELITGKEAFSFEKGEKLTSTVTSLMLSDRVKVEEMVDPRLKNDGGFQFDEAMALACISEMCLSHSPMLRPSATHILASMRERIHSISPFTIKGSISFSSMYPNIQ